MPSSAQTTITVTVADVSTTVTVSAPASVERGAWFNVSGILVRDDTGTPIPNAEILHSYNGNPLGSTMTGVDGDYLAQVKIDASGTFNLKAKFAGMTVSGLTLLPSDAVGRITTGAAPVNPMLIVLLVGAYLLATKK